MGEKDLVDFDAIMSTSKGKGEVNPVHAYYNGSCTSKDNEDPSWSTSFKTRRTQKTSLAKLDKALYGLKQTPMAWMTKESQFVKNSTRNLLKKYEISDSSSVKTPMVPPNNLGPDLAGKSVNKTSYRGMIGSLMCLKGTLTLGLYYPKCLGFDLKGYSDSDYAGCNMDRKSTLGACQILGRKLVCWSAKK
ncbi:hypothetical protein Tco_1050954 [Tanacetum coccineum]